MSDQSYKHKETITPRPRKPIHGNNYCSPTESGADMVRYGLPSKDEVDNIMSKEMRCNSPTHLYTRNKHAGNHNYDDMSSDIDDNDSDEENEEEWSNKSQNNTQSSLSPSFNTSNRFLNNENVEVKTNLWTYVIATIVLILGIISYMYFSKNSNSNDSYYNHVQFYHDLRTLGTKYEMSGNTILQVNSGIATIFKKEDVGSFTFVYNSDSKDFNKNRFDNFVNDIASISSKFLRNMNTGAHHVVLENKDLSMKTHPELIIKYRDEVEKTGVMLVKELENVPANLAMAFHYYCDEYNPLVKKSAIFFTFDLGKCMNNNSKASSHTVIENCLKNKWKTDVPKDNIGPLLARVVNVVVDIYNLF